MHVHVSRIPPRILNCFRGTLNTVCKFEPFFIVKESRLCWLDFQVVKKYIGRIARETPAVWSHASHLYGSEYFYRPLAIADHSINFLPHLVPMKGRVFDRSIRKQFRKLDTLCAKNSPKHQYTVVSWFHRVFLIRPEHWSPRFSTFGYSFNVQFREMMFAAHKEEIRAGSAFRPPVTNFHCNVIRVCSVTLVGNMGSKCSTEENPAVEIRVRQEYFCFLCETLIESSLWRG